jgi:hypothetical protein
MPTHFRHESILSPHAKHRAFSALPMVDTEPPLPTHGEHGAFPYYTCMSAGNPHYKWWT